MKILWLLIGLAGIVRADIEADLMALLEPIRAKHHLPALGGAIFTGDGLLGQAVTGLRKAGSERRVTISDRWHLGSNTKAMTAMLVGTFVAEKKLAWDDTMETRFPGFAKKIDPKLRKMTIAQLLSHRSGLVANLAWSKYDHKRMVAARKQAAMDLLASAPEREADTYLYSNAGYVIAGAILEDVGGKPWEELLTERIFKPLKMDSAGFGGVGSPGKIDQPWGHTEPMKPVSSNGPAVDNPAMMGPAGTVHASLADWSKFLVDQMRGGGGQKAMLPPEIYTAIQKPRFADSDYGFGWSVTTRDWAGGTTLNHSGSNTMNFAVCWISIPRQFGVLICTNQAGEQTRAASDEAASALIGWQLKHANF